ncbi:MAG TPA: hypothetical protein VGV89_02565 [Thermoplasmata archaeon]|nr:hypothetical protein [Thermoplasmata archaeon]
MNAEARRDPRSPPNPDRPTGDSAYADGYAAGYGEGIRESLREILQHASRGHTAAELRVLIESRLARIPEDVELKRKSLMAPPRRPSWGPLLRAPGSLTPEPPPALPAVLPGNSYLFREERPDRGARFFQQLAGSHDVVVWLSVQDPPAWPVPPEKVIALRPTPPSANGASPAVGPSEAAGQIQHAGGPESRVAVYVDSLEFFLTEYGHETTMRFASWLGTWPRGTRAVAVVSVDPGTLEERERHLLQRAFSVIA